MTKRKRNYNTKKRQISFYIHNPTLLIRCAISLSLHTALIPSLLEKLRELQV